MAQYNKTGVAMTISFWELMASEEKYANVGSRIGKWDAASR